MATRRRHPAGMKLKKLLLMPLTVHHLRIRPVERINSMKHHNLDFFRIQGIQKSPAFVSCKLVSRHCAIAPEG